MRLVDDDGEGLAALRSDLVEDEGKLLHRRDDDLLPLLDELAQVAGPFGVAHRRAHLHELLDGRLDLVVEKAPVGDHNDGIEYFCYRRLRFKPMSWCASHAMEFDLPLPAEC